jgi:hypothetical protein
VPMAPFFRTLSQRGTVASLLLWIGLHVGTVEGQTHSTVSVPAPWIANATRQLAVPACELATRAAQGERALVAATSDTLLVRILQDTTGAVESGTPDSLALVSDGKLIDSMGVGQSRKPHPSNAGTLVPSTLAVVRQRDSVTVCTVALRRGEAASTDTLPLHLARNLQREIDSLRLQRAVKGSSFIMLSLIKSVAGKIPEDEFFDIRMRLGGPGPRKPSDILKDLSKAKSRADSQAVDTMNKSPAFTSASIDVSLASRASDSLTDTASSRRLTDATLALNWIVKTDYGRIPDRIGYIIAPWFKVFNTQSYLGAGYGGLELQGSRLEGSTVNFGYLYRYYDDSLKVRTDTVVTTDPGTGATSTEFRDVFRSRTRHNLYMEFYLRVPGAQFLDKLRVRGGVLFPLERKLVPETRIVLSVPILDLDRF